MCLAIPGKILSLKEAADKLFRQGKVSFGGITKEVNLCMVPEATVGDYVLVHVGVAISKIDEEEAQKTF
ncbi:MAG: HypC/HybG/HupF family hydrogenase formation chaperone, partial [Chitinophagales bacterium]